MNYLVVTTKRWNISAFQHYTPELPGNWYLLTDPAELTRQVVDALQPTYIFFPHWSWRVPSDITAHYPCVCFHMTPLPFGRGGSPLQHLISLGYTETKLSALLMTSELDAGPIFAQCPLDLAGSAQDIFERAAPLVYQLINRIITESLRPQPQQGEAVYFKRRTPAESELPMQLTAEQLYNFIRMLDADTYPPAFLDVEAWRLEFSHAQRAADGTVNANVRFIPKKGLMP